MARADPDKKENRQVNMNCALLYRSYVSKSNNIGSPILVVDRYTTK